MSTEREEWAAATLASWQGRYEAGDKSALLEAADFCLLYSEPAPDWIRGHFHAALMRFARREAATLDDAFALERSTDPRTLAKERRAVTLGAEVWQYIWPRKMQDSHSMKNFLRLLQRNSISARL